MNKQVDRKWTVRSVFLFAAWLAGAAPALASANRAETWDIGAGVSFTIESASHVEPFDPWIVEPLDGYGRWIFVPDFDGPIWFPRVEAVWRPYVNGYWVTTTIGVMWVSDEPWGWLTHHYGRWVYLDGYGWGWVPGYDYAPAWVAWVVADDCIGWAPLPPDGFHYRRHPVRRYGGLSGYYGCAVGNGIVDIDYNVFVFVSNRDFHGSRIHGHEYSAGRAGHFFRSKNVRALRREPDAEFVSRITERRVEPVRVEGRSYRAGDRRVLDYQPAGRPDVQRSYQKPAPRALSDDRTVVRKETRNERRENAPNIRETKKRVEKGAAKSERSGSTNRGGERKTAGSEKREHNKKKR